MATTATPRRRTAPSRQAGYCVAATVNAVVLYLILVRPGWREVPILTDDTSRVIGLLTVSLFVGMAFNLLYAINDAAWLTSLGGVATTAIGLAVLWRIWQVFPFDFGDATADWPMVARVVLIFAIAGSAIGIVTQFVSLLGALAQPETDK